MNKSENTEDDVAKIPCLEPYINLFKKHIRQSVAKQEKYSNALKVADKSGIDFWAKWINRINNS